MFKERIIGSATKVPCSIGKGRTMGETKSKCQTMRTYVQNGQNHTIVEICRGGLSLAYVIYIWIALTERILPEAWRARDHCKS